MLAFFCIPAVAARGDYVSCLKRWTKFYNINQFFIPFTEDVSTNPMRVLQDLFQFLGVRSEIEVPPAEVGKPVHVGENIPIPDKVKTSLVNTLYPQKARLESLIGRKVPWG